MGTARYVYNKTLEYLNTPNTKADWLKIKTSILHALPEWAAEVPYQIKSLAVSDACVAVNNAKDKFAQTGNFQAVKFRTRKSRRDSIFIPKSAVRGQGIYVRYLGKRMQTFREPIPEVHHDCRLVYQFGKYFLCVPITATKVLPDNQRQTLVAIDPGVRTFQTTFAPDTVGKFGAGNFARIYRLCYRLDKIIAQIAKAKCKRKRRLRKAADRIRFKIRNLVDEIHHQTALWMCRNYEQIALPPFESSQMVTTLSSKVARAMLTWTHYRFKRFLQFKAEEMYATVLDTNEAYTSKTCTRCGTLQNIGSKKIFRCCCGLVLDRDVNGARNIFLRALGDRPCTS